jgi:hypothetical protein
MPLRALMLAGMLAGSQAENYYRNLRGRLSLRTLRVSETKPPIVSQDIDALAMFCDTLQDAVDQFVRDDVVQCEDDVEIFSIDETPANAGDADTTTIAHPRRALNSGSH